MKKKRLDSAHHKRTGVHKAPHLDLEESKPIAGFRLIAAKTGASEAVSISGSFLGGTAYAPVRNKMVAEVVAEMLLEGTKKRDAHALNQALEEIGATLAFGVTPARIIFEATCLSRYVPKLIELLGEALREPAFNARSLSLLKKRMLGELRLEEDDMKSMAKVAWSQLLYPPSHPHYRSTVEGRRKYLHSLGRSELVAFHRKFFGTGSFILVAAGDVDADMLEREVTRHFAGWRSIPVKQTALTSPAVKRGQRSTSTRILSVREKASVDMFLGAPLQLSKRSPDYYSFLIGLNVLGFHGFSGRLFQIVRERLGLTYGIYALPGGFENNLNGYWHIWATFAPSLFKKGLSATERELSRFLRTGPTSREVAEQKHILSSHYLMTLASSRGVSHTIRSLAEDALEPVDLDKFLRRVEEVSLSGVRHSLSYLRDAPQALSAAGSITKKGEPIAGV